MILTRTKKLQNNTDQKKEKFSKKKKIIISVIAVFFLLLLVIFFWFGKTIIKIAPNAGVMNSLFRSLPGVSDELKSTEEGRTNIVLLGMRGLGVEGGGLLSDTIMIVSINKTGSVSLVSIPRDLQVAVPETTNRVKINAIHTLGEEKGEGEGLQYMKTVLSDILGQEIHYAIRIDFKAFEELIDALGGIEIVLENEFIEPLQFHEERVCDANVFTVPSGNYQEKISKKTGKISARYPLCYNAEEECGGIFRVPAGKNTLNGEQALCYVRSRVTSSDFDRARRQQEVIKLLKEKAFSLGLVTDIDKVNAILDALGNNLRTDLQLWEMKKFFEFVQSFQDKQDIPQKVLENSEEGLLYAPENTGDAGYILLPRGDSYDRIREMFQSFLPKEDGAVDKEKSSQK
ncbi:MAG: LCP family protein [Candidatus Moraniibacteriota bacterium]|nr:MAG: LCP family protein [Candidatus Moranbacteria bacterium]